MFMQSFSSPLNSDPSLQVLMVFIVDKRIEDSKCVHSVQVRTSGRIPRGVKEGQWRVRMKDIVEGLLKSRALFGM